MTKLPLAASRYQRSADFPLGSPVTILLTALHVSLIGDARTVGPLASDIKYHEVGAEEKPAGCAGCIGIL